ncbi:hypothetical protein ABPD30_004595 [Vibrio parahaemolyticus]|nr:hypothetical protein [Vibrio parahaemolyticus]EGQ9981437.1 hypothetical protein [Vibrio parahaemolyticus]EJG1829194.1 hypothetical protein [Vibrio parahaemolyticus]ELB2746678.1 hypothetical protein [Vibrio parahaemolyticus]ELC9532363.1 hypothetical protein [Vibrio parahaemolyticus]
MSLFGLVIIIFSSVFKYIAITDTQVSVSEVMIEQAAMKATPSEQAELAIAKAKLQSVQEKVFMAEEFDFYASLSIAFGLVLSIAGFVLWYFKTQRYLDQILRKQLEE